MVVYTHSLQRLLEGLVPEQVENDAWFGIDSVSGTNDYNVPVFVYGPEFALDFIFENDGKEGRRRGRELA
jgi:hypothetical protein